MHPLNIFFLPQQTSLSHPACLFCPREFCRCKTRGKPYFVGVRLYIKGTFAQRQCTLPVAAAQKDCYVAPQNPLRPIKNTAKKIHLPSGATFSCLKTLFHHSNAAKDKTSSTTIIVSSSGQDFSARISTRLQACGYFRKGGNAVKSFKHHFYRPTFSAAAPTPT